MAILIEFVIGSLLAIYFHWVLHYEEAAYVLFGVGILISLATYLLHHEILTSEKKLAALYQSNHELSSALSSITDPECQLKSQELLSDFKKNLTQLERGYLLLNEVEFYLEGVKAVGQSRRCVKAVDPLEVGWDKRGAVLNYYQANLEAIERGVKITRVFVISRRDLLNVEVQKTLQQQHDDGVEVLITYREDLSLNEAEHEVYSLDFAIYDDAFITDRGREKGRYFGKKTQKTPEIVKYQRLFALIEHHSHKFLSSRTTEQDLTTTSNSQKLFLQSV
jgi:hypothetical protein